MTEIWLPIEGYENLYEVSNLGRVRRLESFVTGKNGVKQKFPGKILKPGTARGYLFVNLSKNGIQRPFYIHRLVSAAFLPDSDKKFQVNHRDENKQNNSVENLEWCSAKENLNYGTRNKRISEKRSKPVLCVELNQIFSSLTDAAKHFKVTPTNLHYALTGRHKTACGYHFEYV